MANWDFNVGIRQDVYNGLTDANQTEPRLGVAYNVKQTGTVAGVSYARTLETPFNENLVLSSTGCSDQVLSPLLACSLRRFRNHGSPASATNSMPGSNRPLGSTS